MRAEVLLAHTGDAVAKAAAIIMRGGLVAFPTDTVYGVGTHGLLAQAVHRLYAAKLRPRDKAIPLLLADAQDMTVVGRNIPPLAWHLAARFWPGALTLVVPRSPDLPDILCAGGDTVAVRVPDHPVTLALIRAVGAPLATTSANLSGHPPATTADEVLQAIGDRVDLILDGGVSPGGVPSSVLDVTMTPPRLLREGALSLEELQTAWEGML